jgi:hypothetical protein
MSWLNDYFSFGPTCTEHDVPRIQTQMERVKAYLSTHQWDYAGRDRSLHRRSTGEHIKSAPTPAKAKIRGLYPDQAPARGRARHV